jgi:hydroxyacylglutathione hydrolase
MTIEIEQFGCLSDNFGVLVHDPKTGATAAIDAPEAGPIERVLAARGWVLTDILVTHHHHDHVGGVMALKDRYGARVVGPRSEADRIPGITLAVGEGDTLTFGSFKVDILATPGHTLGHIVFVIPEEKVAFCGDTLFALGCGRVFEGTTDQMWGSLSKLAALPPETSVYCGHEYTLSNARFSMTVDPDNAALATRTRQIERLRSEGRPTLPTTIALECATNPFLRAGDAAIKQVLGMNDATPAEVFAELRLRKNKA